ncbi:MAG TPA: right-handed parallel beta-helix repeat-containing protein [Rhodanobacteraceae bacterium]|nr:right-handed parallel beta-helix repeat-containing protein [Rhodanobacteraceae bacterium]
MLRKLLLLMPLAAGAGLVLASPAMATTVCVSSTAQLRSALASWQSASGGTYTIKLVQGTYPYPNLDYWSQPYAGGDARLLLLGGYTAGCSSRSLVATNTVLDGQQATHDSEFGVYGASSILVEGITFKSFARNVTIDGDSNDAADSIVVRYVIGTDLFGAASTQQNFAGFSVTGKSNIRVESSLFYNVHGGDTAAGLGVFGYDDNVVAVITNVTSAYNGARGLQMGCYQCSGSVLAYNTILYNNAAGDLDTRNSASIPVIAYSDLDPSRVAGLTTSLGNINADPRFQNPLNGNFLLLSNSPAINIGAAESTVPGGYASQDLDGGTRVIGSRVDLGAFESNINDLVAQTVTSSGDDSLNATLRTAINTANTNPNATTINFNIAGACPRVITLSSPLPDISADTTINGYSQPGARPNTQYLGYDGQICVILRAANAAVGHALRVSGSGRLTLQGVEIEGFATAGVRLAAGNGSVITGSGFAAMPGAAANGAGIRIEGTANHSLIGGLSAGSRNVFNQGSTGVDFEGNGTGRANNVQGNYFGFNFDGSPWAGAAMTYGVYLVGSGGNTIGYNYIGGMASNGVRLSGPNSTGNTLVSNSIGVAPDGTAAGNNNAGVGIAVSAHDNVVGAASFLTQSGGGNIIANNFGPGVWLESGAGSGNRIDGNNAIRDNGGFLAVDLAAPSDGFGLGPTANDNGDVDSGPNNLQNYPFLSQAKRIEARTIVLGGFLQTQTPGPAQDYRLDVFWTDACTGSGPNDTPRGEMKRYVGFFFVHTDGSAFLVPWSNLTLGAPANIPGAGYLFATATDAAGNTSEPGKCFPFTDDYLFTDGFGP